MNIASSAFAIDKFLTEDTANCHSQDVKVIRSSTYCSYFGHKKHVSGQTNVKKWRNLDCISIVWLKALVNQLIKNMWMREYEVCCLTDFPSIFIGCAPKKGGWYRGRYRGVAMVSAEALSKRACLYLGRLVERRAKRSL